MSEKDVPPTALAAEGTISRGGCWMSVLVIVDNVPSDTFGHIFKVFDVVHPAESAFRDSPLLKILSNCCDLSRGDFLAAVLVASAGRSVRFRL